MISVMSVMRAPALCLRLCQRVISLLALPCRLRYAAIIFAAACHYYYAASPCLRCLLFRALPADATRHMPLLSRCFSPMPPYGAMRYAAALAILLSDFSLRYAACRYATMKRHYAAFLLPLMMICLPRHADVVAAPISSPPG